jgi:hypothetical protein
MPAKQSNCMLVLAGYHCMVHLHYNNTGAGTLAVPVDTHLLSLSNLGPVET